MHLYSEMNYCHPKYAVQSDKLLPKMIALAVQSIVAASVIKLGMHGAYNLKHFE